MAVLVGGKLDELEVAAGTAEELIPRVQLLLSNYYNYKTTRWPGGRSRSTAYGRGKSLRVIYIYDDAPLKRRRQQSGNYLFEPLISMDGY